MSCKKFRAILQNPCGETSGRDSVFGKVAEIGSRTQLYRKNIQGGFPMATSDFLALLHKSLI